MQRDVKLYAEALAAATHRANAAVTALEADQAGAEAVARARALRLQAARIDEEVVCHRLRHDLHRLPQRVIRNGTHQLAFDHGCSLDFTSIFQTVIDAGQGSGQQAVGSTEAGC